MRYALREAAPQRGITASPYDSWKGPEGETLASFHRSDAGFTIRFPGRADVLIDAAGSTVTMIPVPGAGQPELDRLFDNCVQPVLDNHTGQLTLHGSAVAVRGAAIAFLGPSRSGKTTLAAGFAQHGHPFLTEDAVRLGSEQRHRVKPHTPSLRLFPDSAAALGRREAKIENADPDTGKVTLAAGPGLPFCNTARPLAAIYVLGTGDGEMLGDTVGDTFGDTVGDTSHITRLAGPAALAAILPHAFLLDSEDRIRLSAHFDRLATLAQAVPCFALDYPRRYADLPRIVNAIVHHQETMDAPAR